MRHLSCAALVMFGALSCWSHAENSDRSEISSCFQSSDYEHCHSQDGAHDLDCYKQHSEKVTRCVWKPSQQSSNNTTYTVIIEQKARRFCGRSENISKTTYKFEPYEMNEMTVYVVEQKSCTPARFTGIPANLVRCGPPTQLTFGWNARQLMVTWAGKFRSVTQKFLVEYRELNSLPWNEVDSCLRNKCIVGNLTSALPYEVKVRCIPTPKCNQCPWSDVSIAPPALTSAPEIKMFHVTSLKMGKRLIVINWKLANNESVAGYKVLVGKESGEFSQTLDIAEPTVRLVLSGSAYYINISAINSASTSPPAHRPVPAVTNTQDWDFNGNLSVVLKNSSFKMSWNQSLSREFCCYAVEWGLKGEKMSFSSLHRKSSHHANISLRAPLQPYERYVFLLHTRPEKDTCNLKSINNSESTNGMVEAYAKEGTPIRSPENVTCLKATSTSLALAWEGVSEKDAQGFLLGYIIYYAEAGKELTSSVVVNGAGVNRYTLSNLTSQMVYEVQIAAFTAVGEGVRSRSLYFETANSDHLMVEIIAGIIGVVLLLLVTKLSSVLCRRSKRLFWPSIPNPGNSNAIQQINGAFDLDVLEPLGRVKPAPLEETDTSSLLIIEAPAEIQPDPTGHLAILNREEEPLPPTSSPQGDEGESSSQRAEPWPVAVETAVRQAASFPAVSDYTTMELFQQTMAQPITRPQRSGPDAQAQNSGSNQDYIRKAPYLTHTSPSCPSPPPDPGQLLHFSTNGT